MLGNKKAAEKAAMLTKQEYYKRAIEYISQNIESMHQSSNWDLYQGMIYFAYDMGIIEAEERQALAELNRAKAAELREIEKAEKEAQRIERQKVIAAYEAERKAKAKAAKAKMAEGAK